MSRGAILPPDPGPLERFLTGLVFAFHVAVEAAKFTLTILGTGAIVALVAAFLSLFKGFPH